MTKKTVKKLSNYIDFHNGENTRKIFMSYGRLSMLSSIADFEDLFSRGQLLDPNIRYSILLILLADRDEDSGELKTDSVNVDDISIDANVNEVIDWAMEHIINFFIEAANGSVKMAKRLEPQLEKLKKTFPQVSTDGS